MMEQKILDYFPLGIILTNDIGTVLYRNELAWKMTKKVIDNIIGINILDVITNSSINKCIKNGQSVISSMKLNDTDAAIIYETSLPRMGDSPIGLTFMLHESLIEHLAFHTKRIGGLKQEFDLIMSLVGELITISDANGIIMRVNEACERIMGVKEREFVGKPIEQMEKEKIIDNSSTKRVIKEGRNVTVVQTTKSGKRLLVKGYPIFNEKGELEKVINISKDITETEELLTKLNETKELLKEYQTELHSKSHEKDEVIIKSPLMKKTYDLIEWIAEVDSPVLFRGESGVGKEFFANILHQKSSRRGGPFVKVNLGSIPEEMIETELFGSRGSFIKSGAIVTAQNGVLFLDEMEKLPVHLQVKLLQVFQEKKMNNPVNEGEVLINVRVICSTTQDLEKLMEENLFRSDLYYWLNVAPIYIPSLRERSEEIPFLAHHFLTVFNEIYNRNKRFNQSIFQIFMEYPWTGNVRELQNTIERLVVTISAEELTEKHLSYTMLKKAIRKNGENQSLKEMVETFEKHIIEEAIENSRTLKDASIKLGIDASTLSRKIKKLGIDIAKMQ